MTVTEMKTAAQQYVAGRTVFDPAFIIIVNEALDQISDLGLCYATVEVAATAGTWYEMPDDATNIIRVTLQDGTPYSDWDAVGQQIKFSDDNTYEIISRRQPPHVTTMVETPQIHPLFHQAIITYAKGYLKLQINDTSADGQRQMQKFEQQVARANQILNRSHKPVQWKVQRHA